MKQTIKSKHNKKRNTAFLYEVLVRELTKSTLNKNEAKEKNVIRIIKEFFSKGTVLYYELKHYKTLCENKLDNKEDVIRLVDLVIKENDKLDKKKVFVEQSKLISKMNKLLSKEALQTFVPNYKNLATIYQLLNLKFNPKNRMLLENVLVENIINSQEEKMAPISNLVFKSFVKRFNEVYSGIFLTEQKALVNKYITSFVDNGSDLKLYLNEEIGRLRNVIQSTKTDKELTEDKEMVSKIEKVLETIEDFKKSPINESMIVQILKIQQLAEEINT
jgi:hypothetical protein